MGLGEWDRRDRMGLGEQDKGHRRGRRGQGVGREGQDWMWGQDGTGERRGWDKRAPRSPHEPRSRRGRVVQGDWEGTGEDRDGTGGKGWDRGDRMKMDGMEGTGHAGGQSPAHTGPRAPTKGPGRSQWGWEGLGTPWGPPDGAMAPLWDTSAFSSAGSVGTPTLRTPALAEVGCRHPLLPAGGPRLGAPPVQPRMLPARRHSHACRGLGSGTQGRGHRTPGVPGR